MTVGTVQMEFVHFPWDHMGFPTVLSVNQFSTYAITLIMMLFHFTQTFNFMKGLLKFYAQCIHSFLFSTAVYFEDVTRVCQI